jgi:hypothetical protein
VAEFVGRASRLEVNAVRGVFALGAGAIAWAIQLVWFVERGGPGSDAAWETFSTAYAPPLAIFRVVFRKLIESSPDINPGLTLLAVMFCFTAYATVAMTAAYVVAWRCTTRG